MDMIREQPVTAPLSIVTLADKFIQPLVGQPLKETLPLSGGDPDGLFTHRRYVHGKEVVTIRAAEPADGTMEPSIEIAEALFGGYLFAHYGHFVAESLHRLWPVIADQRFAAMPIVFAVSSMHGGTAALEPFMHDLFAYLRIDAARVKLISESLLIRRLHVPGQARWLGRAPAPGYDALFRPFGPLPSANGPRHVYVSRSRHLFSGGYVGELLVEEILSAAGVTIIVPENYPAADLISIYRGAENIAFSEGSAIHLLEISGGIAAHVLVIGRRDREFTEERFVRPIEPLCTSVRQFSSARSLASFKVNPSGRSDRSSAPVVVDIAALLAALGDFYGLALPMPTRRQIGRAMVLDLGRIALDPHNAPDVRPKWLGRQLLALRRQVDAMGLLETVFDSD
jgi:hypothetical protein